MTNTKEQDSSQAELESILELIEEIDLALSSGVTTPEIIFERQGLLERLTILSTDITE